MIDDDKWTGVSSVGCNFRIGAELHARRRELDRDPPFALQFLLSEDKGPALFPRRTCGF